MMKIFMSYLSFFVILKNEHVLVNNQVLVNILQKLSIDNFGMKIYLYSSITIESIRKNQ